MTDQLDLMSLQIVRDNRTAISYLAAVPARVGVLLGTKINNIEVRPGPAQPSGGK